MSTLRERFTAVASRRLASVTFFHAKLVHAHFFGDPQKIAAALDRYRQAVHRLDEALVRLKALPPPLRRPHRRPNRRPRGG